MQKTVDWNKLARALTVEAQYGYTNLQGQQYRFSEFLLLVLRQPPEGLTGEERQAWVALMPPFQQYDAMVVSQRQATIAFAKDFFARLQQRLAAAAGMETPTLQATRLIPESASRQPQRELPTELPTRDVAAGETSFSLESRLADVGKIGTRKAGLLQRLGLVSVRDLLTYYPRDYIDYVRRVNIEDLEPGTTVTIVAEVVKSSCFTSPKNNKLAIMEIQVRDNTGKLKIGRFFAGTRYSNRGWQEAQKRKFAPGVFLAASGLVKASQYGLTLDNPELEVLSDRGETISSLKIGKILPVYSLVDGVPADVVRESVAVVISSTAEFVDPLPKGLRSQYALLPLPQAIAQIHFPEDNVAKEQARRRLVFDEFFYLQLGFLQRRQLLKSTNNSAAIIPPQGQLLDGFMKILPFQLTKAQERVVGEILADLEKDVPMNRLVQGDVGSGKTVVAIIAMLAAIQAGYQTALMAPTEVLAEQHYRKCTQWLTQLNLPVELLTGSTKAAKRREIYRQLTTGELPVIVGTHALIQDKVNFQRLGLAIIDEQHRFGVYQRASLQQKGEQPHILTMTATPIPRTIALTLHGDLDVSQIDELPPGRQPIKTVALLNRDRTKVYDLIRREISQGRQAYIVLPLVEESEKLNLRAAVAEHQKLSETIFPEFKVGLLHGKMASGDKDKILNQFRDCQLDILVSTTVIEVGVDVPNATVMAIENSERFGLSQLHQLRGRIGRGEHRSFCILMLGSNAANARDRASVLEQSQDGFWISEMDLQMRGPGEVLGSRQSGVADFALASLSEDTEILNLARDAAEKIALRERHLRDLPALQAELDRRYEKLLGGGIFT
jgi:ATP-dependent DNA helicase RecG